MNTFDNFALSTGYLVILMGTVLMLALFLRALAWLIWRGCVNTLNEGYLLIAFAEWRERNPEKWAEIKRRNWH